MSWVSEIKDICGDYMIDIKHCKDQKEAITLFFNSKRNAETVKRCIEVDASVPNVATPVDFVEVVRCKDCRYAYINSFSAQSGVALCRFWTNRSQSQVVMQQDDFCNYGERREK